MKRISEIKMNNTTFNIGIIGFGIGKIYAAASKAINLYYPDLPRIELSGIATNSKASGEKALDQFAFRYATQNYLDILNDQNTDAVIVSSPNNLHHQMISAALDTDKAIYVDKPLALNFSEAEDILTKSKNKNKDCHLGFEFRYCPALQKAKALIDNGKIGKLYSYRINYFRPSAISEKKDLRWKGEMSKCGDGVINDYGPHIIDLAIWLTGLADRVSSSRRIYTPERNGLKVDAADHYLVQTEIRNGVIGSLETSRMITGSDNDLNIEIYGSKGSLKWSLMQPNYLQAAFIDSPFSNSWINIMTGQDFPEAILPGKDTPVGIMRFYIASLMDFISHTINKTSYSSGLMDGIKVQAFVEAATKAAFTENWEDLPKLS